MLTNKKSVFSLAAALTVILLLDGRALAIDDPIMRYDNSSVLHESYPSALTTRALYLDTSDLGPEGISRLDLHTFSFKRIVGAHPYYGAIQAIAARGDNLVYVKSSTARAPRGFEERNVDRLFVSDGMGRNRKVLHRETFLQDDYEDVKNIADCGREINGLQLLPDNRIQIIVVETGMRSRRTRCRGTTPEYLTNKKRFQVIRFTLTGKRVFSRRFRLVSVFRDQISATSVSGNGRYLLNPERDRIRIVDLETGRKRFKKLSRASRDHAVLAGFDRSAVVVEEKSSGRDDSTNEFRFFRDIVRSDRSRHLGLVKGEEFNYPFRCGRRLFMSRTEADDTVWQIGRDGRRRLFASLPANEVLDGTVCDENRVLLHSYEPKTEDTLLRLLPFRQYR